MTLEKDDNFCKKYDLAVSQQVHEYQECQLRLVKIERDCIMSMGKEHVELLYAFNKVSRCDYI